MCLLTPVVGLGILHVVSVVILQWCNSACVYVLLVCFCLVVIKVVDSKLEGILKGNELNEYQEMMNAMEGYIRGGVIFDISNVIEKIHRKNPFLPFVTI